MATIRARVHSGNRKIYERKRVGLNCGKDGMAERVGGVVMSLGACRKIAKDRMGRLPMTGISASSGRSSRFVPSTLGVLAELGKSWRKSHAAFRLFSFLLQAQLRRKQDGTHM
jgi:hypothetical protein